MTKGKRPSQWKIPYVTAHYVTYEIRTILHSKIITKITKNNNDKTELRVAEDLNGREEIPWHYILQSTIKRT
jgi:hypothetical protein